MKNHCTVCNEVMNEDSIMYYCEGCGCNIPKRAEGEAPKSVGDGECLDTKSF